MAASVSTRAPVKKTVNIDADVFDLIELWRKGAGPGGKDVPWQEGLNIFARRGGAALTEGARRIAPAATPTAPAVPALAPESVNRGEGGDTRPLEIAIGMGAEDLAVALRILSYLAACVPAAEHNGRDQVKEREIAAGFRHMVRQQG